MEAVLEKREHHRLQQPRSVLRRYGTPQRLVGGARVDVIGFAGPPIGPPGQLRWHDLRSIGQENQLSKRDAVHGESTAPLKLQQPSSETLRRAVRSDLE